MLLIINSLCVFLGHVWITSWKCVQSIIDHKILESAENLDFQSQWLGQLYCTTSSLSATSYLYAAIPASLLGGILNDLVGRRLMSMLCCLPLLGGIIIMALADGLHWLLLGRIITSIAVWLCYPSATVLISECVHPSVRGYLGMFCLYKWLF